MSILVLDVGVGTASNVVRALRHVGADANLGTDLDGHDAFVLAGVGHFGHYMDRLRDGRIDLAKLTQRVADGAPILGICVGAQVLLRCSEEAPLTDGLGLLPGQCVKVSGKAPRIGWYSIASDFGKYHVAARSFYFVHSFVPHIDDWQARDSEGYTAMFGRDNILGVQFHPERSGSAGLDFFREWAA